MSTRSIIGVQDGKLIKAIYCHWDGYVSHNGRILYESYGLEKTHKLIALGDLSSLRENIEPTGAHSFDKPQDGVCVFYGRDRGEDDTVFRVFQSEADMVDSNEGCDFFYILRDDGNWYVSDDEGTTWKLVSDIILSEKENA